jgi:hypothetical protein
MINDIPCQSLESHNPSFDDFERVKFEERLVDFPSSHEEDSRLGDETLDYLFHNRKHHWDVKSVYFEEV